MAFWEFILGKYQSQAQSTEETGKYCKNPEVIKRRKIVATFLWLLFTAQESCDLCIAASSQQGAEPDHHPVMAPEMSFGVTGLYMDSKTDSLLWWGFPQEFLFWCHGLQQCLLIHINLKMFIRTFFTNFLFLLYFALRYCIGFAIHQHESTTGVHFKNH